MSITASALITVPSTGTTSPVRTSTTSPVWTWSTATSSSRSPTRTCATFGARWISAVSSRRARREAIASSEAPPENIRPITAPASSWPSASAPTIATSAIVSTPKAVLDDHRTNHLDRQLSSEHRNRHSPHRLPSRALADEIQEATGHDRDQGKHRQNLSAVLQQPHQPVGTSVVRAPGPSARARDRGRGRSVHTLSVAARVPVDIRGEYGSRPACRHREGPRQLVVRTCRRTSHQAALVPSPLL